MPEFVFRDDEPLRIKAAKGASPQVIGEALEEIKSANGGALKPRHVVDAARNKSHPLHKHFEWDDAVAAEAHRRDQARHLISLVCVVDPEGQKPPTRQYYSLVSGRQQAYRTIDEVRNSAAMQTALLEQLDRELEGMERRSREIADVCAEIRSARARIQARLALQRSAVASENRAGA